MIATLGIFGNRGPCFIPLHAVCNATVNNVCLVDVKYERLSNLRNA